MKSIIRTGAILLTGFLSLTMYAQNNVQELVVPLSDPGKPGTLQVNIIYGSIKVSGTNAKDVIIHVSSEQKKVEDSNKNGMRKIPNNSFGITAEEDNNIVKVGTDLRNKDVVLEIQVPQNFNLKLRDVNNGNISVENVNGEMEVMLTVI